MVLINRFIPEIAERCVALDNYKGAWIATEHLIRQGHTQMLYISSTHHIEDTSQRLAGYKAALAAYNNSLPASYVRIWRARGEGESKR